MKEKLKKGGSQVFIDNVKEKLMNMTTAFNRYPVIVVFLVAAAVLNIIMIENESNDYINLLLTLVIGVMLSLVAQQIYERFFIAVKERVLLQIGAALITVGYYFTIRTVDIFNMELEIKTAVGLFALTMVFIWVPSVKSKVLFNQTFMATFKAFFTTVLFTIVIAIGLNLSIFAVDRLLVPVYYTVYAHILNVIFTLFSPLFFLSLIPLYPGKEGRMTDKEAEQVSQATSSPKVLEVLLSYVIVPLAWLYTFILAAYILLNIGGDFWTDNLLEPMLVSYSITIIVITILVSRLTNAFAVSFRKILPKVLLPIILFQLIASVLKVGEMGITHGRYYVLLFGLFALLTSIIFSFFPIEKSGWIAAILIVFSIVSIVPPIDAFTVSRVNQTNLLQKTLMEHDMWQDGEIVPNSDLPIKEQRKITQLVDYLNQMDYTKRIEWLPSTLHFKDTFGFHEVYGQGGDLAYGGQSTRLSEDDLPIDIDGFQQMLHLYVYSEENGRPDPVSRIVDIDSVSYHLEEVYEEGQIYLQFTQGEQRLLRFNLTEAFTEVMEKGNLLTVEEATVTEENDDVRMRVITHFADEYEGNYSGEIYVLIEVK